jgi:type II secretory pathway pseudopilin PulG
MIVLVILTGALAIVWPNLSKPLQRSTLNEAAQQVRSVLDEARYQAMLSGQFWFIRLEKESDCIEYGCFSDFIENGQSEMFAALVESSNFSSNQIQISPDTGSNNVKVPRCLKLPSHIIVTEVVAGKENSSYAFTSRLPATLETSEPDSDDFSKSFGINEGVSGLSSMAGSQSNIWCVPVLSRGLGHDTAIRLKDTKIDQSILIVFSATTGAIEIF